MLQKEQLKKVFGGVSSVLFQVENIFPDLSDAVEYSNKNTYEVGDRVKNGGKYYENKTSITTPEDFTAAKWTEIKTGDLKNIEIAPDYDLPVTVDKLTMQEGDTTVNHFKVFGVDADWFSTSSKGDFELNITVPTLHTEVLKLAYGEDGVQEVKAKMEEASYTGVGWDLNKHLVKGSMIIVDEAKENLLVLSNVKLWASLVWDNASTEPIAVKFAGTLEANEGPDILFLRKKK